MKKICFIIGNINHTGGTERVTSMIANALVAENYEISILSLVEGSKPYFYLDKEIKTYSLYNDKISMKKNFLGAIYKIRKFIKNHNINALVVVDSISCVFTVPALIGLKTKHICWEHFNYNVTLGSNYRVIGRQLAAKYCDYIITLTKRDKTLWEKNLKEITAKIIAIPNPRPFEKIKHSPNLQNKIILSIGRLTYQKGFDLLLQAWAKVCHHNATWKLYIVGDGEDKNNLIKQAKRLRITERIAFIPPTKDIAYYYSISSYFCMSSRFEGLPMVLLEAQSYGLPVISFNCDTGPSEIITNGYNGFLVEQGNVDMLAEVLLKQILIDEEQYNKISNNSKIKIEEFNQANITSLWLDVLDQ